LKKEETKNKIKTKTYDLKKALHFDLAEVEPAQ